MQPDGHSVGFSGTEVAKRLKGDIPCVSCGYNLRRLSVLDVCPECGTPVRATVLAVVDPYASVLQPVRMKRLVAGGLMVWSGAAAMAALITWFVRAGDVYAAAMGEEIRLTSWARLATWLIVASSIAAVVLIRPHAKIPLWQSVLAGVGVLSGLMVARLYWDLQVRYDIAHARPFVEAVVVQPDRAWMRLQIGSLLAATVLLLRPAARMLAARSLVLRMGRVDRQTMLAMAGALGVAALGDLSRLAAFNLSEPFTTALNTAGVVMIAVGSMLFTVGLLSVVVDCVRIAKVIITPAAALGDVVGGDEDEGAARGGAKGAEGGVA